MAFKLKSLVKSSRVVRDPGNSRRWRWEQAATRLPELNPQPLGKVVLPEKNAWPQG